MVATSTLGARGKCMKAANARIRAATLPTGKAVWLNFLILGPGSRLVAVENRFWLDLHPRAGGINDMLNFRWR